MDDSHFARLEAQVTAITRPAPPLLIYFVIVALAGNVVFPFLMLYLYFRYHTLHYRFDADGVSMGYGILFRREMHLTYARMQDIHLSQNIFERWLGIGSVTVQTAGGGEGGDLQIVGVREFEAIRDYLYARMRGVREGRVGAAAGRAPGGAVAGAGAAPDAAGAPAVDHVLAEIRDELRAAAQALGARRGGAVIAALVLLLRPVLEPLLKLRMAPPHLPEGATEVRHLKPSAGYLSYRYVGVLLAGLVKTWALGVPAVIAVVKLGPKGLLIAVPLALLLTVLVGLVAVATRLDWELRDYLIGDRSLRVRQGAWVQREVTLSFANVQNVEVTQGPLERLFGFKSLKVTTAGGSHSPHKKELFNSHEAVLAGLTNAEEIRELVMTSLRRRRDAGLGDADDAAATAPPARAALDPGRLAEVLAAARELRAAAEGLR